MTAYWCYQCQIAGHPTSAHPVPVPSDRALLNVTWLAEALRRLDFTAYGSLAELPNASTIASAIVTEYNAVHDRCRRAHDETHDDPEDCGEACWPFISHDPAPDLLAAARAVVGALDTAGFIYEYQDEAAALRAAVEVIR